MEEGLYEVDVDTLAVKELIRDGNIKDLTGLSLAPGVAPSGLPGYHGKGLFSGQGRLVYSNNGEQSRAAQQDPTTVSGALAEWTGTGDWQLVRRNQFTEVRGPGDLSGNPNPDTDPLWALGWDHRSLLLMLLDGGVWSVYRLPKGSHSYDGAHGWNTEWPRLRDIGEDDFLATMHGTFWRFPKRFSRVLSAGIAPRSNYLKVVGDFCRWNDRLVLGCDDSAASEFLNKRPFKSEQGSPGQSTRTSGSSHPSGSITRARDRPWVGLAARRGRRRHAERAVSVCRLRPPDARPGASHRCTGDLHHRGRSRRQ